MDDMMTIAAAADQLGISVDTLRTWALTGRIQRSVFTSAQGRLVPRAEVERLAAERAVAAKVGVTAWAPTLPPRLSPTYSPLRRIFPGQDGRRHDR